MASSFPALEATIAALYAELAGIQTALAADVASGPMPSDSFQGQSVDFVGWRTQLSKRQTEILELLQQLEPYEFHQSAW